MLFQNLKNKEFKEYFEKILSENLNSKIDCRTSLIDNEIKAYIFLSNNSSTLLSVYMDREELFTPHAPEHADKISKSIENFNKLCNRNEKIENLCS